jgi:hypothetical protein
MPGVSQTPSPLLPNPLKYFTRSHVSSLIMAVPNRYSYVNPYPC